MSEGCCDSLEMLDFNCFPIEQLLRATQILYMSLGLAMEHISKKENKPPRVIKNSPVHHFTRTCSNSVIMGTDGVVKTLHWVRGGSKLVIMGMVVGGVLLKLVIVDTKRVANTRNYGYEEGRQNLSLLVQGGSPILVNMGIRRVVKSHHYWYREVRQNVLLWGNE